jgi:hypothetical protein
LISGFLFIVVGFAGTYTDWFGDLPYARLFSGLIGLLVGAHRILVSFSHIRVHENGVLAYLDLVKWEKIESFQWISGNDQADTLQLKYKGRLPAFMRRGAIPVPIEKKTDLELILEQYLSVSLPAPQPAA